MSRKNNEDIEQTVESIGEKTQIPDQTSHETEHTIDSTNVDADADLTFELNDKTSSPDSDATAELNPTAEATIESQGTLAIEGTIESTQPPSFELNENVKSGSGLLSRTEGGTQNPKSQVLNKTVGEYKVLSELGRGGMGVVYKAEHKTLKRTVAIKMILAGQHAGESAKNRFLSEAQAVAHLQHPNIVQIFDIGEHEGLPFFSIEFVDGSPLDELIKDNPTSHRETAEIVAKLSEAMQYAHDEGILHRDIKPGNVLIAKDGTPKVTDFGLAKQLNDEDAQQTRDGTILGTPAYMSPEQAGGRIKDLSPAADQYSLGAMMYRMLVGRPPFVAPKALDVVMKVRNEEPSPLRQFDNDIPADLETICLKTLSKDPAQRYESCQHLADDLQRYLNGEPIKARAISQIERGWRWCKRNPVISSLGALATLLLIGVAIGSTAFALTLSAKNKEIKKEFDRAEEQKEIALRETVRAQEQEKVANEQSQLALQAMQDSVTELYGPLVNDPSTIDLRVGFIKNLCGTYEKLGDTLKKNEKSQAIPTLMAMQMRLVQDLTGVGKGEQAIEVMNDLLETAERRLIVKENSDAARSNLAKVCMTFAQIKEQFESANDAAPLLERAVGIADDIIANPTETDEKGRPSQTELVYLQSSARNRRAVLQMGLGNNNQAEADFRDCLKYALAVVDGYETDKVFHERDERFQKQFISEVKRSIGQNKAALGLMLLKSGRIESGLKTYEEVYQAAQKEYESNKKNVMAYYQLGNVCGNYGFQAIKMDKQQLAEKLMSQYASIMRDLGENEKYKNVAMIQDAFALSCYRYGLFLDQEEDSEQAKKLYDEAVKLRAAILAKDPNNKLLQSMLMIAQARKGDTESAIKSAIELAKLEDISNKQLIHNARCYALSSKHAKSESEKSELIAKAIENVSAAIKAGFKDPFDLETEPDLKALFELPEYKKIIEQLKNNPAQNNATKPTN